MSHARGIIFTAFTICLVLCATPSAFAASKDIHMLPPFNFDNTTVCAGTPGSPQLLAWDGVNAINCIPGVTGNSNGDLTAPNLFSTNIQNTNFNGSLITANILKFLSGNGTVDVTDTVVNLTKLGACPSPNYQALTRQTDGTFACIAVTDIVGVGKTIMPSCPTGSQIYFTGAGFICQVIPVPAYPVNCTGANALQFNAATNSYSCQAVVTALPAAPPVPPVCPDGAGGVALQFNGSGYSCVPPSALGVAAGAGCDPASVASPIIAGSGTPTIPVPNGSTADVTGIDGCSKTRYQCQNAAWTPIYVLNAACGSGSGTE